MKRHADHRLVITHTIAGDLAAGKSLSAREQWKAIIRPFRVLPWIPVVDWEYRQAFRFLQSNGLLIESNDLWIAATGVAHGLPIITRNTDHYRRIPGLTVFPYT